MRTILMVFAFALALSACEKENKTFENSNRVAFSQIEIKNLPEKVSNHVRLSYPNASVIRAGKNTEIGYELFLSLGWQLFYNTNGEFVFKKYEFDDDAYFPVLISSLPVSILNHVNANYAEAQIVWAERDDDGFDIYLNNGYELEFTLAGAFIKAEREEVRINSADLPPSIQSYIQQNFPNASIIEAALDYNVYEVYLNNGYALFFSKNGDFIGYIIDDLVININELPQTILDFVSTNYPNQSIIKAEIDDNRYEVELNNNTELYFDMYGNFLFAEFE